MWKLFLGAPSHDDARAARTDSRAPKPPTRFAWVPQEVCRSAPAVANRSQVPLGYAVLFTSPVEVKLARLGK